MDYFPRILILKISIISVVKNRINFISRMLNSVKEQTYSDIEHIIIDGNSNDGSKEYLDINRGKNSIFISYEDNGIYDALNKGIKMSTGNIIGMLHSDDYFASKNTVSKIAKIFNQNSYDAVFGDIEYVNSCDQVTRVYSSKDFNSNKLAYGIIPAHTSLFLDRSVFFRYGYYDPKFMIAGDFEFMARIFKDKTLNYYYAPFIFTRMNNGGLSNKNLFSRIMIQREIIQACQKNGIKTNHFKIFLRYFRKIFEFKLI